MKQGALRPLSAHFPTLMSSLDGAAFLLPARHDYRFVFSSKQELT